jgi:hypothetical protein
MKSILKVLAGAAAIAVLAVAMAPVANAQCAPAQNFASIGLFKPSTGGFKQVVVNTSGVQNAGKEIGRFWAAGNSGNANNFAGTCPSTNVAATLDSWWDLCTNSVNQCAGGATTFRGINGNFTGGTCTLTTCPNPGAGGDQMIFLVEEWGPAGPPGIGQDAYWVAFRVDGTPAAARLWDIARVTGNPPVNAVLPFNAFPVPQVTGSSRNLTGGVDTTNDFVDLGLNMHSIVGVTDAATVVSYDLCTFHGPGDPGRLRSAGWVCSASVPYTGAAKTGAAFKVPCAEITQDTWYAVGVTFNGGSGAPVKSELVGRAIQVECDPTIAEPEPLKRPGLRPTPKKPAASKPARSGR